ncbi:hypothetical protein [Rhodocaloribacter sp.]
MPHSKPVPPPFRLTIDPPDAFSAGASDRIAPTLYVRGARLDDLRTLTIWINGRDVTARLDRDAEIIDGDPICVRLPVLRFGGGLHHVRAAIERPDGARIAIGESYYEVGGGGPAQSVIDPRGEVLVPAEPREGGRYGHCCCPKEGGRAGAQPPGGQPPGDGNQGAPDPDDKNPPPNPDCKIVNVRIRPQPTVSERTRRVRVEVITDPANGEVVFARNFFVTYIAFTGFLLAGSSRRSDPRTVTRQDLGRKGVRLIRTDTLDAAGLVTPAGPRAVEIEISEINRRLRSGSLRLTTFQNAGVPTAVTIGARCKEGGRKAFLTVGIRDPLPGDDDDNDDDNGGGGSP